MEPEFLPPLVTDDRIPLPTQERTMFLIKKHLQRKKPVKGEEGEIVELGRVRAKVGDVTWYNLVERARAENAATSAGGVNKAAKKDAEKRAQLESRYVEFQRRILASAPGDDDDDDRDVVGPASVGSTVTSSSAIAASYSNANASYAASPSPSAFSASSSSAGYDNHFASSGRYGAERTEDMISLREHQRLMSIFRKQMSDKLAEAEYRIHVLESEKAELVRSSGGSFDGSFVSHTPSRFDPPPTYVGPSKPQTRDMGVHAILIDDGIIDALMQENANLKSQLERLRAQQVKETNAQNRVVELEHRNAELESQVASAKRERQLVVDREQRFRQDTATCSRNVYDSCKRLRFHGFKVDVARALEMFAREMQKMKVQAAEKLASTSRPASSSAPHSPMQAPPSARRTAPAPAPAPASASESDADRVAVSSPAPHSSTSESAAPGSARKKRNSSTTIFRYTTSAAPGKEVVRLADYVLKASDNNGTVFKVLPSMDMPRLCIIVAGGHSEERMDLAIGSRRNGPGILSRLVAAYFASAAAPRDVSASVQLVVVGKDGLSEPLDGKVSNRAFGSGGEVLWPQWHAHTFASPADFERVLTKLSISSAVSEENPLLIRVTLRGGERPRDLGMVIVPERSIHRISDLMTDIGSKAPVNWRQNRLISSLRDLVDDANLVLFCPADERNRAELTAQLNIVKALNPDQSVPSVEVTLSMPRETTAVPTKKIPQYAVDLSSTLDGKI